MAHAKILVGDVRFLCQTLPRKSIQCCVTSPPYFGLRDYGVTGQIGLESTVEAYVEELVAVFADVRDTLTDDGTLWLNLGDSYARAGGWADNSGLDGVARGTSGRARTNMTGAGNASQKLVAGLKSKDLIGMPWRVAFALQADGWYLRSDIIWSKPNPMPEGVTDRPTKAHEYVFLLSKSARYYYDAAAITEVANEGGVKNARSVWHIPTKPYSGAHFATMPLALADRCVRAGSSVGSTVLDPFAGSGTTLLAAVDTGRNAIGIDLNAEYALLAAERIGATRTSIGGLHAE